MELFDYIEVFYNQRRRHRPWARSARPPSNDAERLHSNHGGRHSPGTDDEGQATERLSAFSITARSNTEDHYSELTDLTDLSTRSDQAQQQDLPRPSQRRNQLTVTALR